jgi:peptide/nickel transport system permease protein
MLRYIIKRALYMLPTLAAASIICFWVIQLPPGNYLTAMVATMSQQGDTVDNATLAALKLRYGLDEPIFVQYWKWISGILFEGDFGHSFELNRPVSALIWERIALTLALTVSSLLFVWAVAFPTAIVSAVRKYSILDYVLTAIAFVGLALPNFLIALVLMYLSIKYFGHSVGGLFSPEFADAPWSLAKALDLLQHLWIPMIVLGTAGTGALVRLLRANLLDELGKPYVLTARAKGLSEMRLFVKYPLRVSLNFFVSSQSNLLMHLISGGTVVAIVLSLPTTGPLLMRALIAQDLYLAGSFLLMMSVLNVICTLLSDIALAMLDPRIRYV